MRYSPKAGCSFLAVLLLLMLATPALADIPMFFVIAFAKVTHWWTLPLILAIEAAALHWIFEFAWKRAVIASIIVNLVTGLLGIVVYPAVGMSLYPGLAPVVIDMTGGGTRVELGATLMGTAVIDTLIELLLLGIIFKVDLHIKKSSQFLFVNILTAGILFATLVVGAMPDRMPEEEVRRVEQHFASEIQYMHKLFEEMPDQIVRFKNTSIFEFNQEWRQAKWIEADGYRFHQLWIRGPASSANLQNPSMAKSRRVEAQYRKGNIVVTRGWEDEILQIYWYEIHRTVKGEEFAVVAIFESPE
jgi:hypothetical protein